MPKRSFIPCRNTRGFTLLEILIAIFILGIVLTTIWAAHSGTLTVIRELGDDARAFRMARTALDRMSRDLSALQRTGEVFVFKGEESSLGRNSFGSLIFRSVAHLSFEEDGQPGIPASIAYFVKEDADGGFSLWRSDIPGVIPATGKKSEGGIILCENIQAFHVKYFDEEGRDYDAWNTDTSTDVQKNRPPARIQMELILTNKREPEKPYRFATRVFIPVRK